jgi:hypothetical protein
MLLEEEVAVEIEMLEMLVELLVEEMVLQGVLAVKLVLMVL